VGGAEITGLEHRITLPGRLYAKVSPVQAGELTFSSDIAYSDSPAASKASSKEA
jgi:hypothetical protein